MITINGIAASRVKRPTMISAPPTISTVPTKGTHHLRIRYPDIDKAPGAEDLGKNQLLNSFGKNTTRPTISRTRMVQPSARVRSSAAQRISDFS
jgi:hypothetical protein